MYECNDLQCHQRWLRVGIPSVTASRHACLAALPHQVTYAKCSGLQAMPAYSGHAHMHTPCSVSLSLSLSVSLSCQHAIKVCPHDSLHRVPCGRVHTLLQQHKAVSFEAAAMPLLHACRRCAASESCRRAPPACARASWRT